MKDKIQRLPLKIMSKYFRFPLCGCLLSLLATGCLKSDEPVRFQNRSVSSVSSTVLGMAAAGFNSETGKLSRIIQLRNEGGQTYLYNCEPGADLERIQATLYAIPNQSNTYVLSLQEGSFFLSGGSSGHEFFIVQPHTEFLAWWNVDDDTSEVARRYFSGIRSTSTADTYPVASVKDFLVNHTDEFIEEKGTRGYRYVQGMLNSCNIAE